MRTPSATMRRARLRLGQRSGPRATRQPSARLRLCEPVQVSTRSPEPGQPREASPAAPPSATAEPHHLGEPARDQRRPRVLARARARRTSPVRDGHHVLQRAARARRRPRRDSCRGGSAGAARRALEIGARRAVVRGRDHERGGPAQRDLAREGRAGEHRHRPAGQPLGEELATCAAPCRGSRPLVAETQHRLARDAVAHAARARRRRSATAPRRCTSAAARERLARVGGGDHARPAARRPGDTAGSRAAARIDAASAGSRAHSRTGTPAPRRGGSRARCPSSRRRAPPPARAGRRPRRPATHATRARSPSRDSVPLTRRAMFSRWRHTMITAASRRRDD